MTSLLAPLPWLQQVALEEKALSERYPEYEEYKKKVKKVRPHQGWLRSTR